MQAESSAGTADTPAAHECNVQQLAQRVSAVEGSIGSVMQVAQDAQRGVTNVRREGKRKAEELHQELDMVRQQAEGAYGRVQKHHWQMQHVDHPDRSIVRHNSQLHLFQQHAVTEMQPEEGVHAVEAVVDDGPAAAVGLRGTWAYKLRWAGLSARHDSWVSEGDAEGSTELIAEYWAAHPSRRAARTLRMDDAAPMAPGGPVPEPQTRRRRSGARSNRSRTRAR